MRTVALLLLLALTAGCGEATRAAANGDPAAPRAQPSAEPTWPTQGCSQHVQGIFDFFNDEGGVSTREEAAEHWMRPGDRLRRQVPQPKHYARGWMVVTSAHEIRAILGIVRVSDGFRVDSAEECAG